MKEYFEKWNANRSKEESRLYLIKMFSLLFYSKKLRLISDLKTVYNLPPYYLKDYKQLEKLHLELLKENNDILERFKNFPENVEPLKAFEECIKSKNEDSFYWLSKLIEKENKTHVKSIWDIVTKYAPNKSVNACLLFFFNKMTHRETWIYLYHAILLIIHANSIDFEEPIDDATTITVDTVQHYFSLNIENKMIEIDDFVNDLHTGLKAANLKTKFAIEGALVVNENKKFLNNQYRNMYIKFKEIIDEHETKMEESKTFKKRKLSDTSVPLAENMDRIINDFGYMIINIDESKEKELKQLPQAQKRTASYKKAVFVDTTYIYKGPYDANDLKLLRNLKNLKAIILIEEFLKLDNKEKTVEDWCFIYKNCSNQYYLVTKNVGIRNENIEFDTVTTKIDANVKVIKRKSFVKRMSEVEQDKARMTPDLAISVLQHLYSRYLLEIGDSGTHNILLREDDDREALVNGIDLEEQNTSKSKRCKIESIFKQASSFRKSFYKPYLNQIKTFQSPLTEELKAELAKIKIDTTLVDENINNWIENKD